MAEPAAQTKGTIVEDSHNVRSHLRLGNDAYDEAIRRFIPGYEEMLSAVAEAVASTEPALVVDLGAGTGALAEALLEKCDCDVELIDIDPEMMAQARERLSRFGERARYSLRSYDEPFAPCDAFAASLALHHIPTLKAKSHLFRRMFDALSPGGVFVNGDVNMPEEKREADRLYRFWANHLVKSGIEGQRAWQYFEEWSDEDSYLPLEDELGALEKWGFDAAHVWERGPVGVVVARR